MKSSFDLILLMILLTVLCIGLALVAPMLSPEIQAARAAEAWHQAREAAARAAEAPARQAAITEAVSIGVIGLTVLGLVTLAGVGLALVRRQWLHAAMIYPQAATALYPALPSGDGQWLTINDAPAQTFAALAASGGSGGLRAPVVRALASQFLAPPTRPAIEITEAPLDHLLAAPAPVSLPGLVSIYQAPLPAELGLPIGVTADGTDLSLPLDNLGNILIGGLPGSGKSELLAAMLVACARQSNRGRKIQPAIIDTKLVDFGPLPADLAPLYAPVAMERRSATDLLYALREECQQRFTRLLAAGARSLSSYNRLDGVTPLPYVVCLVDEWADFAAEPLFNDLALEIGRKGRAAGVSLVLATQRPSADTIDARLRAVAGSAIALRTRNASDSRLVIGESGAEAIDARTPGRCLVQRGGEIVSAQAYCAGLRTGEFDQFIARLPRRPQPRHEFGAGTHTGTPAPQTPQTPANSGIPVSVPAAVHARRHPDAGTGSADHGFIPALQPPDQTGAATPLARSGRGWSLVLLAQVHRE